MNMEIAKSELAETINKLEELIKFSFNKKLNLHSTIGAKYGELYVAYQLYNHNPLLASWRTESESIKRRKTSADIILDNYGKKIEVKWGALHHLDNDYYYEKAGKIEHWGWGFSQGNQFNEDSFHYVVLLAAKRNLAVPEHIFVCTCSELKDNMERRVSGEGGKDKYTYFLHYSDTKKFYEKPENNVLKIEKSLYNDPKYQERWLTLKKNGSI